MTFEVPIWNLKQNHNYADTENTKKIHEVRDQKVMLDYDLAELYDVETKNLNKAVKRNVGRFPKDFMFQLTKKNGKV